MDKPRGAILLCPMSRSSALLLYAALSLGRSPFHCNSFYDLSFFLCIFQKKFRKNQKFENFQEWDDFHVPFVSSPFMPLKVTLQNLAFLPIIVAIINSY